MTSKAKVLLNNVDIKNLIDLNWNQLSILLTGMSPKESKKVIQELIKKLLVLQTKLSEKPKNDNYFQNIERKTLEEVEIIKQIDQDFEKDSKGKNVETDYE